MKGGAASWSVHRDFRGQEVQFHAQLGEVITPLVDRLEEPLQPARETYTLWTFTYGPVGPAPIVREAPEAGCHMTRTGVMQRGRLSTPWHG